MTTPSMLELRSSNMVVDNDKHSNTDDIQKLMTYEIFSILENNFLFGGDDHAKLSLINNQQHGKVRILSIDDGGSTDGVLSAKTLLHLQSILRTKSGNPTAHISDFFDVVTGAGTGGVLAGLLFTRAEHGGPPMFTADESLKFMVENGSRLTNYSRSGSVFRRTSSKAAKELKKVFGDHLTLKDAVKAVLIPCYDLRTGAPFLFSRADALEMDGCDFSMADVCGATVADRAVELKSTDGRTKIVAVGGGGGGVGMMNNPTAAAITHVLNNKQEFPVCEGVEDLLVVSLGNGVSHSSKSFLKIAADGAADMVLLLDIA
ncbi:hypothetical protein BUALT_Bualt12G0000200 [Buddleja alternifolia]|uniref:PNPLA domain-containing protein n=1 Tax=Buddleja alternifolia TaxID=168488 RepID=A0AAV6WVJ2_9LAMI|nr:hypothetical protein BUALT_Bualt12G0000200 [Buddleja alternifolia]